MIRTVIFVLAIAALPASAQTAAERLHKLAEDMVEREFDLNPARETYAEGAGRRSGKAVVDLSPDVDQRHRGAGVEPQAIGDRERDLADFMALGHGGES